MRRHRVKSRESLDTAALVALGEIPSLPFEGRVAVSGDSGPLAKWEIFNDRRKADPQGVIDDLIKQTTRQGVAIHDLALEVSKLREVTMLSAARWFSRAP